MTVRNLPVKQKQLLFSDWLVRNITKSETPHEHEHKHLRSADRLFNEPGSQKI